MFKIYWTDNDGVARSHDTPELTVALRVSKEAREAGHTFVTMVSENPQQVGKAGVDAIVDGKTPDGHPYDWSKAGRAGKPRNSDKVIVSTDR